MNDGVIVYLLVMAVWLLLGHAFFGRRWIPDGMRGIAAVYVGLWQRMVRRG